MKTDSYQTGETVVFSGDMPQGSLIAVGTSHVEANQTENTEDLLYAEVTYDEEQIPSALRCRKMMLH